MATLIAAMLFSIVYAHDWQYDLNGPGTLSCDAAAVNHSKIVVAAVGDSITVGATCRTWHGGFVKVLNDILERTYPGKYDVRDCGVCGTDAVRHGHGNIRHASYWDTGAHTASLAMKPDIVIYMLGTNDADGMRGACGYVSLNIDTACSYDSLNTHYFSL